MRALKAVVFALGALCIGAVGFLVYLVATGSTAKVERPAAAPARSAVWGESDLGMPHGSQILAVQAAGDALAIHLRLPDGTERVVVFDPRAGVVLGRIVPGIQ